MGNAKPIDIFAKTKSNEGFRLVSYPDGLNYAACWGNHFLSDGTRIKKNQTFTQKQCDKIFKAHVTKRVLPYVIPLNLPLPRQMAVIDYVYQRGAGSHSKKLKPLIKQNLHDKIKKELKRGFPERKRHILWG